ncbi:GATA-binding factor 2 [Asimina triloba]
MHILEDIESVLNFFEDGDDGTSSSHSPSPVEGFAGDHVDDIPIPIPVAVDAPFQELNWALPEDSHLFLHGLGFLDHPTTNSLVDDDHWMMHGLEDHQSTATTSTSVENGREKGGDGIGIDPKAKKKEMSERWVHGKSRSKRIRRIWPLQALPVSKCCSHCKAEKTPQWRMGPLGPKTLCNACGVRYKSGRLVPEYRPAASPTFVTHLHSNSHRKIMQMREQRNNFIL